MLTPFTTSSLRCMHRCTNAMIFSICSQVVIFITLCHVCSSLTLPTCPLEYHFIVPDMYMYFTAPLLAAHSTLIDVLGGYTPFSAPWASRIKTKSLLQPLSTSYLAHRRTVALWGGEDWTPKLPCLRWVQRCIFTSMMCLFVITSRIG